uniref:LITAF domain-containing protein n=1 Tax=Tanacetum cinerariifolium TaxID=118510 RepID=A0A6L2N9V5_TANCI|nr:hypothetical protein [Tanacetum cinerariifolium]
MVPYEAFACPYGDEDVVLRESYKPKTRGSSSTLIYSPGASTTPIYSPGASTTLIYSLGSSSTLIYSPGASTTPIYSPGSSSTPVYSPGASRNAECSNCKHLFDKITVLEATIEMYKNPEQHTLNSAALLHEFTLTWENLIWSSLSFGILFVCFKCLFPITCSVCEGPLRRGFCLFCDSKAANSFTYDPNAYSFNDTSSNFNHLQQPQFETYLRKLCGNDSHYGYDCPPHFPSVYE